jgi:hypothetical protein
VTDSTGPVSQPAAGGKKSEGKGATSARVQQSPVSGLLDLQRGAGNQAVGGLFTRAALDPGRPLDSPLRQTLETGLGADLSQVRIHDTLASADAAESVGARAYTVGSDIHLGRAAATLDAAARDRLLAHEAVHAVQQGGRPVPLDGVMPVSQPTDASEGQARAFADLLARPDTPSPALALRDRLRASAVSPHIQRDIVGDKTFGSGKFEINFKKTDATAAGVFATEDGTVTFTPSATAPESDSIKYVQIVRTFDTATGKDFDYTGTPEANRNKMQTARDNTKNIAPGFFVDQNASSLAPRTKKADPTVLPFYDVTGPPVAGNATGKRRGKTIVPAVLKDTPGHNAPMKFNFVTVAKASDTGIVYGTVLWGFETFLDKGIAKIRNEYKSFRTFEGETFVEAVKLFNEFYKNPGTPGAPTK